MSLQTFNYNQTFTLESGKTLPHLQIGYHTYGKLNANHDNVIWVCHALTANSDVLDWWKGFFGEGQFSWNSRNECLAAFIFLNTS